MLAGKIRHELGAVFRKLLGVIGGDGYDTQSLVLIFTGEAGEFIDDVQHKWAVIADEGDKERRSTGEVVERVDFSFSIGQREVRRSLAVINLPRKFEHPTSSIIRIAIPI